jgi:hypothetical protein
MKDTVKHIACLALILCAAPASALDLDYYTYGGFSETVMAFQRVSLLFSHDNYGAMIFIAVVFGIFWGGTLFFTKSITEGAGGFPLKFLAVPLVGVMIYQGLILPKGTVHIYDPTKNSYEAVGNVPDLVIFMAGGWNKFERMAAEIESNSSAYPYEKSAGGIGFNLLFNVTTSRRDYTQHYLLQSLRTFYKDCSELPLAVSGSGFDMETLKSGTNDLYSYLDNIAWGGTSTTYYDVTNKGGVAVSCQDAWENRLRPALAVNSLYDRPLERICESAGFNPSQANELVSCKGLIDELGINMAGVNTGHIALLRNALIAQVIADAMAEENPDVATRVLTNRDMMVDGIGAAINSQEWVMTFRSVMLTVVLGLIPFLAVFIVTPLAFKSLFLMCGLFAWGAIWGIVDVVSNGIAIDQSFRVMEDIRTHGLGLESFLAAPTDSMKSMAIFGKIRGYGAMISTIITGALFGFSGYALSSMAGGWQSTLEKSGTDASDKALNPEARGQQYSSMAQGSAMESNVARMGYSSVAASTAYRQGVDVSSGYMESELLKSSHGTDTGGAISASAAASAGRNVGMTSAAISASGGVAPQGFETGPNGGGPIAATTASAANTQRTMELAQNEGIIRAARMTGVTPADAAHSSGVMQQVQSVNDTNMLESLSGRDLLSGYYGNAMTSANSGRILDQVANNYEGGRESFFEDAAANRVGPELARFTTAAMLADSLDKDILDSSMLLGSTGFSLTVTPDNYDSLEAKGLISPEQQRTLAADGYSGRLDFAYDGPSETVAATTASSGARGASTNDQLISATDTKDTSTSRINRYTEDTSTSRINRYTNDQAFDVQAQTVQRMALNPELRDELASVLRLADDNLPTTSAEELQLDRGLADVMSSVVTKQATESSSYQLSADAGAAGSVGVKFQTEQQIIGRVVNLATGASGYADGHLYARAGGGVSKQGVDSEHYQANLIEAQGIRESAITDGHKAAHQTVLKENQQLIEQNGVGMTPDEMVERREALKYQYAAEYYTAGATAWVNDALETSQTEVSGLRSEEVDKEMARIKDSLNEDDEDKGGRSRRRGRRGPGNGGGR